AEYDALEAAGDEQAQRAFVAAFVDQTLQAPVFYQTMFEMARDWLNVPLVARVADEPEYSVQQQRSLQRCLTGTANAGKWAYWRYDTTACDDAGSASITIEPWWAPGTQTTLVGFAASTAATGTMPV